MNMIRGIKIDNLIKAQSQFEEYRSNISKPQKRAGAIQAFEYTYEMCWKMIKKLLEVEGVKEVYTPKDCFRKVAKFGLITDPKIWFEYLEIRDLTVHTYNEDVAHQVSNIFGSFSVSVKKLLGNFEKLK
jgi:nucleotidyltransferase substrate binding protein (TIGR01987 family)